MAEVAGEATASYQLIAGQASEEETQFYEYFGETQEGLEEEFEFNFEEEEVLVDPTGLIYLESAEKRLLALKGLWKNTDHQSLDQILRKIEETRQAIIEEDFQKAASETEKAIKNIYLLRKKININIKRS